MAIIKKKVDTHNERNLIMGMIISDEYIKNVQHIIRTDLIKSTYVRMVTEWCVDYYKEFEEAPRETIESIFKKKEEYLDEDISEPISTFLESISEEYERESFNAKYVLKETETYFKKRSLEDHISNLKSDLLSGNITEAEHRQATYKEVSIPSSDVVDVMDSETIARTFDSMDRDSLFNLSGDFGDLIGDICRGDFIALIAPAKRGKTSIKVDIGVRAYNRGLKVLFISLEMSESQMNGKIYQNMTGTYVQTPKERRENTNKSKDLMIPAFDKEGDVYLKATNKEAMTQEMVDKKLSIIKKKSKGGELRLVCRPAHTVNTTEIKRIAEEANIKDGFIADVIICDYLDIMAPEEGAPKDMRHSIDMTWKAFAGMCKELNVAGFGSTQGNRGSFSKDMDQGDITEDIRKLAHVTTMFAINRGYVKDEGEDVTKLSEEEIAIYKRYSHRINLLVKRFGYFDPEQMVRVLYNHEINRPVIKSRKIINEKEEEY